MLASRVLLLQRQHNSIFQIDIRIVTYIIPIVIIATTKDIITVETIYNQEYY